PKPAKILLAFTLLSVLSCGKLRQKRDSVLSETRKTVNDARRQIGEQKNKLADKILPGYDSGTPDTESNKKRFKEHLQVALTEDVSNIYAYGDFLGSDYKVLIAFTCDSSTINKIVSVKKMQKTANHDNGLSFPDEIKWWNKDKIALLIPYKKGKEAENWEYLWYDAKTKQAFYEEFSM
ncbi:MAG TPA: hypothetical protein VHL77_05500, partial [Ferruginibacter sp.]|nr:hypothetical protein [Ferruginibacter sp.]